MGVARGRCVCHTPTFGDLVGKITEDSMTLVDKCILAISSVFRKSKVSSKVDNFILHFA